MVTYQGVDQPPPLRRAGKSGVSTMISPQEDKVFEQVAGESPYRRAKV